MLEMRQQQNAAGIVIYAFCTIFILYLAMGRPNAATWNALFWITQLFVVINAVVKSFVGEPRGRFLYYQTLVSPLAFLYARLLLNVLYMIALSVASLLCFLLLLQNPLQHTVLFFGIALLGGVSLSLVFTMLSAIASKARQQASLLAILGLPLIIPQLILLIRLSKLAFGEVFRAGAVAQISGLLIGLDVLVVLMASVLFPYLWKD